MKMEYRIDNLDDKGDIEFENIKVKGYFSVNENNEMAFDCSQLRYYTAHKKPSFRLDSNNGIKEIHHFDYSQKEGFNNIIRWIQKYHENIRACPRSGRLLQPNFILDYVILIRLLRTPYRDYENWVFCAAKWKGNIYLRASPTRYSKARIRNSRPIRSQRFVKETMFTQHMVSDTANGSTMADKKLDGNSEFVCILQSRLGDHTLLYTDHVQAICSDESFDDPLPLEKLKSIKLKVVSAISDGEQSRTYREARYHDWWTLMAPTGSETLVCGYKHREFISEVKAYRINDLPKLSNKRSSSISMNFCNDFLYYVANTVRDDYNQTIYKFEKIPHGDVEVTEVLPFSEYSFLPEWYTRNMV